MAQSQSQTQSDKQFTLYSHNGGPNGWKVAILLEELNLTYQTIYLDFQSKEQKQPAHTSLNPNGRIPTLIDHKNKDFAVWESNAILLYLSSKYDSQHALSVSEADDVTRMNQWLFFQASGQGPYFGQAAWFTFFHPERIQSATERYQDEILRVLGVLNDVLLKQDWLVGGKCTIADLSFIPWNAFAGKIMGDKLDMEKMYPAVAKWTAAMHARPAVAKVLAEWQSRQKK